VHDSIICGVDGLPDSLQPGIASAATIGSSLIRRTVSAVGPP
jgi:hypothetical protein